MPEEYFAINHSMSRRTPSTMDSAGILAEVVALNGAKGTITLGTGTWRIDLATTIPANARLVVEQGAMLTKYGSGTLTINGPFEAPLAQVFSGFAAGEVTISLGEVVPEWWGAAGDDSTDCTLAINCAFAALPSGGSFALPRGVYLVSGEVGTTLPIQITGRGVPYTANVAVFGDSSWSVAGVYRGSVIRTTATSGNVLALSNNFGGSISNILVAGSGSGTITGISMVNGHVHYSNVLVCNCATGLNCFNVESSTYVLPRFRGCTTGWINGENCNANTALGIDISVCGTGVSLATCDSNRFFGGSIQGCLTYGIDATSSVEECLFDGIYFENSLATAAIRLNGDQNKIVNCHQGYTDHDVFLVDGSGHSIELAKYAKAVVLAATSSRTRIRSVGAWPAGSSDAGANNVREQVDDNGVTYSTATGTTIHAIQLSGSTKGYFCLNTTGGIAWSVNARDDVGHVRILDAAHNVAYMAMEANSTNPKISFLGAVPVVRQEVTGSAGGNAALASLLSALESLGLITDSST